MKYLAQALVRGPAAARPAMRTGSPLAEADQRLHLDAFAARFDVPVARRADADALAPDPFEGEASDAALEASVPFSARVGRPGRAERLAPVRRAMPSASPWRASTPTPAPVRGVVVPPPVVASRPRPGAAPSSPFSTSPPSPRRGPVPQASASEASPPAPERSGPRDAVAVEPDRTSVSLPRTDSSRPRATTPMTPPTTMPEPRVPDVISQALAKVAMWLDRPVPPEEPTPRLVEASPVREREASTPVARREPLRASDESSIPSRPYLEIGSIEVEVVTPERPRRAPAPARAPGPTAGSMTPVFGWRQR